MQSGKIKHWNEDKGYGFIDVDAQSENVFFHISKATLSQPISVGQQVYFNSERNYKNQLRATEVTSTSLSIEERLESNLRNNLFNNTPINRPKKSGQNGNRNNIRSAKKGLLSTLFDLLNVFILFAIIAVAVYLFAGSTSSIIADDLQINANPQISYKQANVRSITGDAQIDTTIALIQQGGPFPYPNKDGSTFGNRESRLPAQSQGYYREYTVPTPGLLHRGPRRIVTGGNPPTIYYLTVDHYDSFSKLEVK